MEIQLIGLIFALFMLYLNFIRYKKKEFTIKEYIFWLLLWVIFIIIMLFPWVLDPVVEKFKFARTLDLLIVISFIFLIGSNFYTYTVVRKTQKKVEDLVRKIAFEMSENPKKVFSEHTQKHKIFERAKK